MTVPPGLKQGAQRVTDYVLDLLPKLRTRLTKEESALAIHLRGNDALYESLIAIVRLRIEGRANLPEPSDPLVAKSMIARDRELHWLLGVLSKVHRAASPYSAEDEGEQPAA